MTCVIPKRENVETMMIQPYQPSPAYPSEKFINWVQRSRWKVAIIFAFVLILISNVLYGTADTQTNASAQSSDAFSSSLNTTTAASESEALSLNLNTTTELLPQEEEHHDQEIMDTKFFENSRDVKDQPIRMGRYSNDIPFFWSIPKSGTSTIKGILLLCLNLRMATSSSQIDYDSYDQIQVVNGGLGDDNSRGGHFVNVNFGYLPGIQKAQEWNMAESGLVDVAVTSYINEGVTDAFDPKHPARIFTILRHPILRMISLFNYHKVVTWEGDTSPTLLEYASGSQYYKDNWMTRTLSNQHHSPLRDEDLLYAKRVLKEKVLILLLDEIDESMARLVTFMDWGSRLEPPLPPSPGDGDQGRGLSSSACLESYLHSNPANNHNEVLRNSAEWQMLENVNNYDISLYSYGQELFDGEQRELYSNLK